MKKSPMIHAARFAYFVGGAVVLAVGVVLAGRMEPGLWQAVASIAVGSVAGVLIFKGLT